MITRFGYAYLLSLFVYIHSTHNIIGSALQDENNSKLRGATGRNISATVVYGGNPSSRVLDGVVEGVDLCLNAPGEYGKCSKRRFPKCAPNMRLCIYRQPRSDLFYDNLHRDPAYYIDYDTIECVPVYNTAKHRKWNCNLCDPGVWCESLNRCTKHKKRFCPDDCYKAKFRRWCPSRLKCLRYQDVDGKRKEECPDWK